VASSEKVCVIGAGSSGIASCQVLKSRGIAFDCFEKGSQIGGNWRYGNDNEMSSAYGSLHIDSSKDLLGYSTFPMPDSYPVYPDHRQIAQYFDDYVEKFDLLEDIHFRTGVVSVEPVDGEWEVIVEEAGKRETRRYRAVLVANGHHWDPRWPEPAFPGSSEFTGEQMHSHFYREPDILKGKRVLVLGIGNSAVDIAVESSRNADETFLAMRRGAHVLPKFLGGKPVDDMASPFVRRLPLPLQRLFLSRMLSMTVGKMSDYGLPEPDHKLFEAHPTVSSELLPRIGHGDIAVKPNIDRFVGGRTVRFVDGSEEEIDLAIYCTGYRISFPFLDSEVFSAPENRMRLYERVVSIQNPGLYFIGFIQPLGPIPPIAEAQSEWVADLLQGAALPTPERMEEEIGEFERRSRKRFVASKRHTIEVEYYAYLRELRRERKRVAQPA
jgi:Flavin-binding monooxygenase-like